MATRNAPCDLDSFSEVQMKKQKQNNIRQNATLIPYFFLFFVNLTP